MSKYFTEKEVIAFFNKVHTSIRGVYTIHVPTQDHMMKEHPLLWLELEKKMRMEKFEAEFPEAHRLS